MLFYRLDPRLAAAIRIAGLLAIDFTVVGSKHPPGTSGRGLLVTVLLVIANLAWLTWTIWPLRENRLTLDLFTLAIAGGVLVGATPGSGASAFVFVAAVAAGLRVELGRALVLVALGALAVGVSNLIYNASGVGVIAYALGFSAAALAGSNSRQFSQRAEQAELLLAQTQRSQEEHVRAARLEESTRIAREIHDVLAHALAGLAIQLEATSALLEQGADREAILARIQRAHALAREGLQETRRAVGALRGDGVEQPAAVEAAAARAAIEALVAEYRAGVDAPVELRIDGDSGRLSGPTGQAVVRVAQEALTNVRKHAPGAAVSVAVHAGERSDEDVVLRVDDHPLGNGRPAPTESLAATGGGYGLQGMRERAHLLGGTLDAGTGREGWSVELRLPPPAAAATVDEATR
ncbi:MAG TPA: histidine kinase [Solirubrobacteraceae bacterium]|nr:histidine kinase [Solirubrobacteraceae bacterium]